MKKIILALSLASCLFAGSVKGNLSDSQVKAVQDLIVEYGYRCDSVNFAMISNWDGSIRVTCNDSRYVYEVKDVGGNWTVRVK